MLENGSIYNTDCLVSVVILTYNQKEYLLESIDSVLKQNYSPIQIVISDDGSNNFDKDNIEKYINNNCKSNIVKLTIISRTHNVGTVKNFNGALRQCEGEYIVPLASDDAFYDENTISKIVNKFKNTDCDVLSCSRMMCNKDLQPLRLVPHPAYHIRLKKFYNASLQYHAMARGETLEFASGSALYYKRSYMVKQGLYDERYLLWEDGPFLARTTRNGTKIEMGYEITSILYRKGGISSSKISPTSKIYNDYRNFNKYEFLDYPDKFSSAEKFIIKLKQMLIEKNDKKTNSNVLLYSLALAYSFLLKLEKGGLQLLYKIRRNSI